MSADEGSPANDKFFEDDENDVAAGQLDNGVNGLDQDEDDEDEVRSRPRRKAAAEEEDDNDDGAADDLFGEDEDEGTFGEVEKPARQLDDEELDSGDDLGRTDRVGDDGEAVEYTEQDRLVMDMEIPRQPVPDPSDGEMYLLKVPPFLAIEPRAWQTTTFQPPTTDHHSKAAPSASFSAFNTATSTVRWRHSPSNVNQLQSNARINRWSDGSLTLQFASDPNTQYEIDGNSLAPPQRNPLKPTPTSIQRGAKGGRQGADLDEKYDPRKDAFTYLIAPVLSADSLRVTHKITAGLSVKQTASASDDAVERLQAALASAANATKVGGAMGTLEITEEDPELGRKKAEVADRLAMRERKKRENAQERERLRTDRALGRHGLSSGGRYGGLNVGMLEDDEAEGGRGRAAAGGRARAKPRRRRNSEYSEDEDFGRKRFTREDDYDKEDDFLASSDEEEFVEDDDDPDDGIIESPRESKRTRAEPEVNEVDEDEDAEGEVDEDVPQARTKRRRVVDEDEDE